VEHSIGREGVAKTKVCVCAKISGGKDTIERRLGYHYNLKELADK
jgi:hypothetical protein